MRPVLICAVFVCLVGGRPVFSTTVAPFSLDELVGKATQIFVSRVVDVRSSWVTSRYGRTIVTDVTFSIERTLKGASQLQRILEFPGGTVGPDTLKVEGVPVFQPGDRDVLFVRDAGRPISPVVGLMHGRFRVIQDPLTRAQVVGTHDNRPLARVTDIGAARPSSAVAGARSVSLTAFIAEIESRVRRLDQRP